MAFILLSLFDFAHHTPNSVEKKTPNNLENYTQSAELASPNIMIHNPFYV
jgi:hypothetical protein